MTQPAITDAGGEVFGRCSVMDETRGGLEVPVQHEGIEVDSVGPHDGAQLVVYSDLSEITRIGQRLEDGTMQLPTEIDVACAAVAEAKLELVVAKYIYRGDANELHASILRQRVDGLGRTPILGSLPVGFQLVAVQTRPRHGGNSEADTASTAHRIGANQLRITNRAHCSKRLPQIEERR
jgi:hypothetical protein